MTRSWRERAACRYEDPDLFFPAGTTGPFLLQIEQAKAVCRRCPVLAECDEWADQVRPSDGVVAGLTEPERRNRRRQSQRAVLRPAAADDPKPRTLAEAYARRIVATEDGHILWRGTSNQLKFAGDVYTPLRTAFRLGYGREPEGIVRRTCGRACFNPEHLTDARMRDDGAQCGTRAGYLRHRRDGEEACPPCRRANTDSDNRLRRTGTARAVV